MTGPLLLDSAHLLDGRLKNQLVALAQRMRPFLKDAASRFDALLEEAGLERRQRKALSAIMLGAGLDRLAGGLPLPDFLEEVSYQGRRLAKLNLPLEEVTTWLERYRTAAMPSPDPKSLEALDRLHTCSLVALSQAYYEVRDAETAVLFDLFWGDLESRSLDALLESFAGRLLRYSRAEAALLCFRDSRTGDWIPRVTAGAAEESGARPVPARSSWMERLSTVRYFSNGEGARSLLAPDWKHRFASVWSLPLTTYGRTLGVVQFGFSTPYEWLPREMDLLAAAAERLILAAEKAELIEDLRRREQQVRELAGYLSQVEERERRRISRELHDEAGQSLLCLRLQLEMLEKSAAESAGHLQEGLAEAREISERTIHEIRRLIAALSPNVLDQYGLRAAVKQAVNRFRQHFPGAVEIAVQESRQLPERLQTLIYRVLQECLTNIQKHSEASRVNISLNTAEELLELVVEDNGKGFNLDRALEKPDSFGLAGMKERIGLYGGTVAIKSRTGRGTRVQVKLPLPQENGTLNSGAAPGIDQELARVSD